MKNLSTRAAAVLAASALVAGGIAVATVAPAGAVPALAECTSPTPITVLGFNDFHGRLHASGSGSSSSPYAGAPNMFSAVRRSVLLGRRPRRPDQLGRQHRRLDLRLDGAG